MNLYVVFLYSIFPKISELCILKAQQIQNIKEYRYLTKTNAYSGILISCSCHFLSAPPRGFYGL